MDIQSSEWVRVTCNYIVPHDGEHLAFKTENREKILNNPKQPLQIQVFD